MPAIPALQDLESRPPASAGQAHLGLTDVILRLRPVAGWVLATAVFSGLVAAVLWPAAPGLVAAALGSALGLAGALSVSLPRPGPGLALQSAAQVLRGDPDLVVLTDGTGAALPLGEDATDPQTLRSLLSSWCADPDQTLRALLSDLDRTGVARRDFQRGAQALRLGAHVIGWSLGQHPQDMRMLWRLSRMDRAPARGLDALGLPVLTLSATGDQFSANPALIRLLDPPVDGGGIPSGGQFGGQGGGLSGSLAASLAPVMAQLRPVLDGGLAQTSLVMPGGQAHLARAFSARDGQRDILFLPVDTTPNGLAPTLTPQDFEDIPVALIQLDGEGVIYGTNRAARSLMGLTPAEDRPLWEVVEGLGRPVADWLQDARAGRALNRPEVLRATCAGGETFVQIILRRASPAAPKGALVAVVSDATELKSLEARFVQSQKMQAIGQLAGGIAHDFNNLLTAISGHCDLLLLGLDPYDPDYNDLLQIHQNSNRAAALVRQLLAFSRKQTLQPEILTVDDLLEDVVHLLTRLVGERIQLRITCEPHVGQIRADRRQLEQVIVNLVVNARDAMPMGGEIRLDCTGLTLAAETLVGRAKLPAGHYVRIEVVDTGIGIPPDLIDKIFEPFFTTKRPGEGTGLGLSTAYGIVKQMGGYIFVDSREGSGTTFSIYFATDFNGPPTGASVRSLQPSGALAPRLPGATSPPENGSARPFAAPPPASAPLRPLLHSAPPVPGGGQAAAYAAGTPAAGGDMPVPAPGTPTKAGPPAKSEPDALGGGAGDRAPPVRSVPASDQPGAPRALPGANLRPDPAARHAGSSKPETPTPHAAAPQGPAPRSLRRQRMAPDADLPPPGAEIAGIVLLVEDEAPVRAFAARALRLKGYRVLEAEDGEQALEVLADPGLAVDIFVSDVIMPGRDGPGWVAEALRSRPGTPVVFMSGYIEDTLTEALSRTPQALFLEKPFSLNALCAAIGAQLERSRG